jgi:hypothetical protein
VCVHRRFSLFMPSHQIHIYLRLLEQPQAVLQPLEVGPSREAGVSLAPYLANRFICHIDVCLQCNLLLELVYRARRTYLHGFMGIVPGPSEKER